MTRDANSPMPQLLKYLGTRNAAMLAALRMLVRCESPSDSKPAVDRCARLLAGEWRRRGMRVQILPQKRAGDILRVEFGAASKAAGQILLLGHMDTVYPLGTLARMPFRVKGGLAYGPGTFDMKCGLVQGLFAAEALASLKLAPRKRVVGLWTSDEEVGSDASRAVIEREARRSDAVLVLEPSASPGGKLKTGRKGVGEAEIIVTGRAAHAGLNPEKGVNAIHELAAQIARIAPMSDLKRGATLSVDIVQGGTRSNVIAERARAVVDLRAVTLADARRIEKKLRALRPMHREAKLEVRGGFNRRPMEQKYAKELFAVAQRLGREIGLELKDAFVGGGSDGNLTAALGIPTLDGLGAVGDGAHAAHEHIRIAAMPERAALVAGLILNV